MLKMKMNRTIIVSVIAFFQVVSFTASGQSVFAPKVGAEWNYFVETDSYPIDVPYFNPITGKIILNQKINDAQKQVVWQTEQLRSGLYFILFKVGNQTVYQTKLSIQK